jgi:hypothetical protein
MPDESKQDQLTQNKQEGISRRGLIGSSLAAVTVAAAPAGLAADDPASSGSVYRIHPAIGVARLGNADPGSYFIGPEAPGYGPLGDPVGTAAPPYKIGGQVRPQAARFRLFEYRKVGNAWTPYREVTLSTPGVTGINWTVQLANKKASFHRFDGPSGERGPSAALRNASVTDRNSLNIDFGARSIAGRSTSAVSFSYAAGAPNQSCPLDYQGKPVIDYLGQLRTDSEGRLLVVGGKGKSSYQTPTPPPLPEYGNNDGWFDDASDGPVTATITIQNGGRSATVPVDNAGAAWILCAPPDFAPRVRAAVTMYDLLYDVAVRSLPTPADNGLYAPNGPLARIAALKADYHAGSPYEFPNSVPNFDRDIFPILKAAYEFYWVDALVNQKHESLMDPSLGDPSPSALKARQGVFIYLRPPLGIDQPNGNRTMPHQLGDDPYLGQEPDAIRKLTLTHVQYGLMRRWADGNFQQASNGTPPNPPTLPPPAITAQGLDQAALENCVGGAFFPGIEASWQIRNPNLFVEPFRINPKATSQYLDSNGVPEGTKIAAGHFSRQMAIPWQADFNDCRNEGDYAWWPSQRPTDAFPYYGAPQRLDWARPDTRYPGDSPSVSSHADMVANWWKYAFLVQQSDQIVETERTPSIP